MNEAMTTEGMNTQSGGFSRRNFLKGLGGVAILLGAGGVYRAGTTGVFSSGTGAAFEAWDTWKTSPPDGPLGLVCAGVLASNPHNTQPWLFDVMEDRIDVYADRDRNLASFDPYLREMHLGLGCAVENIVVAAAAKGYAAEVQLAPGTLELISPNMGPELVASIALTPGEAQPSTLFDVIGTRRTNRAAYDPARALELSVQQAFHACTADANDVALLFLEQPGPGKRLADATVESTELICADDVMSHDSHKWFRNTWEALQTHRDGIHIDTAGLPPAIRTAVKMLPPLSPEASNNGWITGTRATVDSSPMLALLAVRDRYDRRQTLEAGRIWQRMHLTATTLGVAVQPINQIVELIDRDDQLGQPRRMEATLNELTGDAAWQPTFAFRAGYPTMDVLHSARRPLQDVIRA